jgi:hypothetical protein
MIYREPRILAVVRLGSSPLPSSLSRQQVVSLSQFSCVSSLELTDGRGGGAGDGGGANHTEYVRVYAMQYKG